jgi:hypothetical protein
VTLTNLSFNGGSDIPGVLDTIGGGSVSGLGPGPTIIGTSTITKDDSDPGLVNGVATFHPGRFDHDVYSRRRVRRPALRPAGDQVATSNPNDFVFSVTSTTPPTGGSPVITMNTYPITTPEPSSFLMLSLGLAGLLGLAMTRKRAGAAVAA